MDADDGRRRTIGTCDDDSGLSEYQRRQRECCPPQLFTSILLGILACVLVTGGVFLAFHKWDHTWLLVSAVGVILMAIGTALHCCSSDGDNRKNVRCKGGCGAVRSKPDVLSNGGGTMLTEQLLPLSNARSVSQLSLNMLPGYFPPLVYPAGSPYSLEQHAAVVQNISKLVQHHQQLHLQSPTAAQSDSKSFILLPLPVDANAANIQNIVAAVCQLDTNTQAAGAVVQSAEAVATESQTIPESRNLSVDQPLTTAPQNPSSLPVYKHVEVQTCNDWGQPQRTENAPLNCPATETALPSEQLSATCPDVFLLDNPSVDLELGRSEEVAVSTILVPIESSPSDHVVSTTNSTTDTVCDIPLAVQLEISNETNALYDVPSLLQPVILPIVDNPSVAVHTRDILDNAVPLLNNEPPIMRQDPTDDVITIGASETVAIENVSSPSADVSNGHTVIPNVTTTNGDIPEITVDCAIAIDESSSRGCHEAEVSLDVSLADIDSQADTSDLESELLDRSSPPPSYDDVTQDVSNLPLNTFGAAYGTL